VLHIEKLKMLWSSLECEYLLESVDVKCLKDHGSISFNGETYTLRKDAEIRLPRVLALDLARRGIVKIIEDETFNLGNISKAYFLEKQALTSSPHTLTALPKNFYLKYREYILKLNERLREKYSRELLEELEKAQREIEDLVRIRLRKILTSIYLGVNIDEIREKLTYEELILCKLLRELIDEWLKMVGVESVK